ncbi:2Fe-2S iron-sulfur cluster-binding protein [Croceicoccus sp. F390]|uniref:2Fe-2S iron-sulfur cluster-binding protein n=1 Tax=Croceicoccus esteveae TaxID=3075597 RepID=A0ABU2ZF29_9SPHN|nr:2Fe-2S iron-sulfur cluster-binding protein [Croceicoccus sp. F390]MDT0575202.1 2Fe-2S iron-sulfur cluster-binding protein [Croceicoccus sp. F390]
MIEMNVTDRTDTVHILRAPEGGTLMEVLQNADLVAGICGGAASCGTCHVYVEEDWLSVTGERTEDETYMLEALEEEVPVTHKSRLSCQIALTTALDGITLQIAPEA